MTTAGQRQHFKSRVARAINGRRLLDLLMLLVFAASTAHVAGLWSDIKPAPRVIYVAPDGSNWHDGSHPRRALKTVQFAADRARPGSEIVILPGVYHERVHLRRGGTAANPITIRAQQPGTVTITGEAPSHVTANWRWKSEGDDVYSTQVDYPVYRLRCDQRTLYRVIYGGLDKFRELVARPHAMPAFYFEAPRLYVFLGPEQNPGNVRLRTHRRVPVPREWGEFKSAQIWCEADHVKLEALQLDFGIGSGILLWNAAHVTISDCSVRGSTFGIDGTRGLKPSVGLTVENCLYHNFPQAEWRQRWLSWDEVYASYSSSSLVASQDDQSVVRNNLVVHAGDALQVTTRDDRPVRYGALIKENLLAAGTDDAFEFDGPARNITVSHNLVYNFHQNLGVSPVLDGPVLITDNLFLHPADELNGSQIKLISNHGPTGPAIRNVAVSGNTFVGNWLYWTDGCPLSNVAIRDNVFAVQHLRSSKWPTGVKDQGNRYVKLPPGGYPNPGRERQWFQAGNDQPATETRKPWSLPHPGPRWMDPWGHECTRSALEGLTKSVVQ